MVSTSRCGRDNPGSNPGHGINATVFALIKLEDIMSLEFPFYFKNTVLAVIGNSENFYSCLCFKNIKFYAVKQQSKNCVFAKWCNIQHLKQEKRVS